MNKWLGTLAENLKRFKGQTIVRWSGIEMALTEGRSGGELWQHPDVPWLQMLSVSAEFENGKMYKFTTIQNNENFGLFVTTIEEKESWRNEGNSIYRIAKLECLPVGLVQDVNVSFHGDKTLNDTTLVIEDNLLSLKAGEANEQHDGSFEIAWNDESVMIQLNGKDPRV